MVVERKGSKITQSIARRPRRIVKITVDHLVAASNLVCTAVEANCYVNGIECFVAQDSDYAGLPSQREAGIQVEKLRRITHSLTSGFNRLLSKPAKKVNKTVGAEIHLINQQRLCIKLLEELVIRAANKQGKKAPSKGELKHTAQRYFEEGKSNIHRRSLAAMQEVLRKHETTEGSQSAEFALAKVFFSKRLG
jgi:hypothetical protein